MLGVIRVLMSFSFWILVALTFAFTYVNGFHDGCNVVATLIASRAMKPYPALALAAVVEVLSQIVTPELQQLIVATDT